MRFSFSLYLSLFVCVCVCVCVCVMYSVLFLLLFIIYLRMKTQHEIMTIFIIMIRKRRWRWREREREREIFLIDVARWIIPKWEMIEFWFCFAFCCLSNLLFIFFFVVVVAVVVAVVVLFRVNWAESSTPRPYSLISLRFIWSYLWFLHGWRRSSDRLEKNLIERFFRGFLRPLRDSCRSTTNIVDNLRQ